MAAHPIFPVLSPENLGMDSPPARGESLPISPFEMEKLYLDSHPAVHEKEFFQEFVLFLDGGHLGLAMTSILTNLGRHQPWTITVKFSHDGPNGLCEEKI